MVEGTAPPIPVDAAEILERDEGWYRSYRCEVGGWLVGYRLRYADGSLLGEQATEDGRPHGPAGSGRRTGRSSSSPTTCGDNGHGTARQYHAGRLLGTYRLEHGTGVDCGGTPKPRSARSGTCIFSEWNDRGRVRRGFPRYFVAGQRVDQGRYLAAGADPSLPPVRAEDDDPRRPLPREYLDQRA